MATDFSNNGATDWYEAAGPITLPDADWAILTWVHLDVAIAGAGFRYYLSNNAFDALNSVNVRFRESTEDWAAHFRDGVNPGVDLRRGMPSPGTGDFLCGAQRRGTTKESFVCPKGGSAVFSFADTDPLGEISSPNLWNIGRRQDGDAARYSKDIFGETAVILNASFSQAEIEDIATGKRVQDFRTCEAIWPLQTPDDLRDLSGNGHTLTKNGAALYSDVAFLESGWQRHAAGSN